MRRLFCAISSAVLSLLLLVCGGRVALAAEPVTLSGELTVLYADDFATGTADLVYLLEAEGQAALRIYRRGARGSSLRGASGLLPGLVSGVHLRVTGRQRWVVSIPSFIAKIQAWFLQLLPKPLLTVDQVKLLATDTVVSDAAIAAGHTLLGLGITPRAMDAILPRYLYRFRRSGQFQRHWII